MWVPEGHEPCSSRTPARWSFRPRPITRRFAPSTLAGRSRTRKTGGAPPARPSPPSSAKPARTTRIDAIGLTGQMHGCVLLDAAGEVLRPAMIWCDQRTQPECDQLTERVGFDRLIALVANPALPNFTLTKLLWVKAAPAGDLRPHRPRPLPQGLRPPPPHRRVRHRRPGSQRHPPPRCRPSPLERGARRTRRHPARLATARLRKP